MPCQERQAEEAGTNRAAGLEPGAKREDSRAHQALAREAAGPQSGEKTAKSPPALFVFVLAPRLRQERCRTHFVGEATDSSRGGERGLLSSVTRTGGSRPCLVREGRSLCRSEPEKQVLDNRGHAMPPFNSYFLHTYYAPLMMEQRTKPSPTIKAALERSPAQGASEGAIWEAFPWGGSGRSWSWWVAG